MTRGPMTSALRAVHLHSLGHCASCSHSGPSRDIGSLNRALPAHEEALVHPCSNSFLPLRSCSNEFARTPSVRALELLDLINVGDQEQRFFDQIIEEMQIGTSEWQATRNRPAMS